MMIFSIWFTAASVLWREAASGSWTPAYMYP